MVYRLLSVPEEANPISIDCLLPGNQSDQIGPIVYLAWHSLQKGRGGHQVPIKLEPENFFYSAITYVISGSLKLNDFDGRPLELQAGDVNLTPNLLHHNSVDGVPAVLQSQGNQPFFALQALLINREKPDCDYAVRHVRKALLPHIVKKGLLVRLIAGEAYGSSLFSGFYSNSFFLEVVSASGVEVPHPNVNYAMGVYVISGQLKIGQNLYQQGSFVILPKDFEGKMESYQFSHFFLVGGHSLS